MNTSTRALLKWEFRWIPVEMAMVGLGVGLNLRLPEAGQYFLWSALLISGAVRGAHYLNAARRQGPASAAR